MFNIREGIDPRTLKISRRLLGDPPQDSGPNRGVQYNLDDLMKAYWEEIGWDPETGIPTQETLDDLELWDDLKSESGGVPL